MKIVLIGFAATYKSSVGKLLAERTGLPMWDVDSEVENVAGKKVAQIFADSGEAAFRQLESQVVLALAQREGIVSCGGGSVLSAEFPALANNATVVWLKASAQSVRARMQPGVRPLFDQLTVEQLQHKIVQREAYYSRFATCSVDTDNKTSAQVAQEVASLLKL